MDAGAILHALADMSLVLDAILKRMSGDTDRIMQALEAVEQRVLLLTERLDDLSHEVTELDE